MADQFRQRYSIEYSDDEGEKIPNNGWHTTHRVRKQCDVEIVIDLLSIARVLGARACRSRGRKCKDGYVTVKQIGDPVVISKVPVGEGGAA